MALVRTYDANGDEVLECETNDKGDYVWNPTPEQFSRYMAREVCMCADNLLLVMRSNRPAGVVAVTFGTPCDGYHYDRREGCHVPHGRHGYYSGRKVVGGIPAESHSHSVHVAAGVDSAIQALSTHCDYP